jgi:hypothetical protein
MEISTGNESGHDIHVQNQDADNEVPHVELIN